MSREIDAAVAAGVALDINSQVDRLDLDELHARRARDAGASIVISSDGHSVAALAGVRWGVTVARRAWLTAADVLNTLPAGEMKARLRRRRS